MNANRRPILRWLTIRLASYLEVPANAVDAMVPARRNGRRLGPRSQPRR